MKDQVTLLKDYIQALEGENASKNTQRLSLEAQLTTLTQQNNLLKQKLSISSNQRLIQALQKQIRHLKHSQRSKSSLGDKPSKQSLADLKTKIQQRDKQLLNLAIELREYRCHQDRADMLGQQLKSSKDQVEQLRQKLEFKNGILAEMEKQKDFLRMENDEIKTTSNIQLGKASGFYQSEISRLKVQNQKLMKTSSVRRDCCADFAKTKQQLNNTIKQNLVLHNELAELRQQISMLRQSHSNARTEINRPNVQNQKRNNHSQPDKWIALQKMVDTIRCQNFDINRNSQY